jgi:sulfatase maturation enzyme AslB (radical SAM superfamily)
MRVQLGLATNLTRDLPGALPARFDTVITSYDPGSRMRGRRAQFEAWAQRVRTSATWSTPLTVSVTLTRELFARWEAGALLDYLVDGLGVRSVQFEPFALQGEGARHRELLEPAPHAVAAFLAAALAWRRSRPSVGLSTLATFAEDLAALPGNRLRANPPSLAFAVDPTGHAWSCERVGVGKPIGHVNATPLPEILGTLRPGVTGKLHASRACTGCVWLRLCARGHRQTLGLDCNAMRALCADQTAVARPMEVAA